MPKNIKPVSPWRKRIFKAYGKVATKQIHQAVGNSKFRVKDIAGDKIIPILDHCVLSTRKSWLAAICAELVVQKKLERIGNTYQFKEKKGGGVRMRKSVS